MGRRLLTQLARKVQGGWICGQGCQCSFQRSGSTWTEVGLSVRKSLTPSVLTLLPHSIPWFGGLEAHISHTAMPDRAPQRHGQFIIR